MKISRIIALGETTKFAGRIGSRKVSELLKSWNFGMGPQTAPFGHGSETRLPGAGRAEFAGDVAPRLVEKSRGRSLPGASLAAETEFVIGTAPSRSRLGIGGLRFRAARVSKRIQSQPKTESFLESLVSTRQA
jgi:hypothetical protein